MKLNTAFVRLGKPVSLNLFDWLPPLDLLFHLSWMRQVRILGEVRVFDQRVDAAAIVEFDPTPWDMIVVALEPATFRTASAFAKMCKAESEATRVVGVGQAIGLDSATGRDGWDLLIHGAGYPYLEEISQGGRPVGLVRGARFPAPVSLPDEAGAYKRSALVGSWGTVDRSNWRERGRDYVNFEFRRPQQIRTEMVRMSVWEAVEYFHFIDSGFVAHPDWDSIIGSGGWGKPWGVTMDGRKRRGVVRRIERGYAQGLRLVKMELGSLDSYVLSQAGRTHRYEDVRTFWGYTSRLRSEGLVMVAELFYGLPQQTEASIEQDDKACERNGVIPIWRRARLDIRSYLWTHRKRLGIEVDDCGLITGTRQMTASELERLDVDLGARNIKRLDRIEVAC
jgi:hypothetical protein